MDHLILFMCCLLWLSLPKYTEMPATELSHTYDALILYKLIILWQSECHSLLMKNSWISEMSPQFSLSVIYVSDCGSLFNCLLCQLSAVSYGQQSDWSRQISDLVSCSPWTTTVLSSSSFRYQLYWHWRSLPGPPALVGGALPILSCPVLLKTHWEALRCLLWDCLCVEVWWARREYLV